MDTPESATAVGIFLAMVAAFMLSEVLKHVGLVETVLNFVKHLAAK